MSSSEQRAAAAASGASTSTHGLQSSSPVSAEDLRDWLKRMQAEQPGTWTLIGPDGRVYVGADPLVLGAQARAPDLLRLGLDDVAPLQRTDMVLGGYPR